MKKAIFVLAVVAAVIALRPVLKRRMLQKMQEHCQEMMGGRGEATGHEAMRQKMREHCGGMAAQRDERADPVAAV